MTLSNAVISLSVENISRAFRMGMDEVAEQMIETLRSYGVEYYDFVDDEDLAAEFEDKYYDRHAANHKSEMDVYVKEKRLCCNWYMNKKTKTKWSRSGKAARRLRNRLMHNA